MQRILYHGSDHVINKPTYGFGKIHNDYGLGFYCTEDLELAKEWAVTEDKDGFANTYVIDETDLTILDLTSAKFTTLDWISLLVRNRTFEITTPIAREAYLYLQDNFYLDDENADVIIGYRADDSYFAYAQDFLNNTISVGQLSDALRLGNLGLQYVLKSEKAFGRLTFKEATLASSELYFPQKLSRDSKARRDYQAMNIRDYIKNGLYVLQIIDEEIKADDPRLR